MINYKILFLNVTLIVIIIIIILYVIKNKNKESFFVTSEDGCPPVDISGSEGGDDGSFGTGEPADYNPDDYYMCKNVGWRNNDSPYKTETGTTWYDAEYKCKNDYQCNSFSYDALPTDSIDSNQVKYYSGDNSTFIENTSGEGSSNNLYVKTTEPCQTVEIVPKYNTDSSGVLPQQNTSIGIPYKYINDYISKNRCFMNEYNDYRIAKDSDTLSSYTSDSSCSD